MLHPASPQHHFPFAACPRGLDESAEACEESGEGLAEAPQCFERAPGASAALRRGLEALNQME